MIYVSTLTRREPCLLDCVTLAPRAGATVGPGGQIMKIVCAWCAKEGKLTLIDEKAPVDDWRETHGVCPAHEAQLKRSGRQFAEDLPDQ